MKWKYELVQDFISEAEKRGIAIRELASPREAELFRYAVNNYRRNKKIGEGLTTEVQTNSVKLFKMAEIKRRMADKTISHGLRYGVTR